MMFPILSISIPGCALNWAKIKQIGIILSPSFSIYWHVIFKSHKPCELQCLTLKIVGKEDGKDKLCLALHTEFNHLA